MNGRIMKKEEFVERMLADQALRKERETQRRKEAHRVIVGYVKARSLKIDHKHHTKAKQGGSWG